MPAESVSLPTTWSRRPNFISTGAWRLYAAIVLLRNRGLLHVESSYGNFRCTNFGSLVQFWPTWESAVKEEVGRVRGLFVDVGANIGLYSIIAARQGCRAIAVEPAALPFQCLLSNIHTNSVDGLVHPIPAAAWCDGTSKVRLRYSRRWGTSRVTTTDERGELVKTVMLDQLMGSRQPDLVKIDAEGAEEMILKGMSKILASGTRVIFEAWDRRRLSACASLLDSYSIRRLDELNYLAEPTR